MILPLILVGFVMLTLGFAMLCVGEVPFVGGKRIPALRSRIIGGILVSYLPVAWLVRAVVSSMIETEMLGGAIIAAVMIVVYLAVVFALVFRLLFPKREPRTAKTAATTLPATNPFGAGDAEMEMSDAPKPAATKVPTVTARPSKQKPSKPAADDDNPFNFS